VQTSQATLLQAGQERNPKPEISLVIPVYNERESLPFLFERLLPVLEELGRSYEILFIDDGSVDGSLGLLLAFREANPSTVRVIEFNGNFGQHMAITAGFRCSRGRIVITMDADLQNPPEEIPNLVAAMDAGHDTVGTYRVGRRDPFFRKVASKIINAITDRITGLHLRDYGCMLRAYSGNIIGLINESAESTTFIPALGRKFSVNPTEIPISHTEREHGTSKYGLFRLIRLNFDLMTGFSLIPLQVVTMLGLAVALMSLLFVLYLGVRRLVVGPEAEGVFTLLNINFFLLGVTMFCVGIVGEYIGRIYQEVRKRPRYVIRKVYDDEA
jgi:undecaprenyl-phosphate 4-deoxy-4-formamido-L-arabinose transferase